MKAERCLTKGEGLSYQISLVSYSCEEKRHGRSERKVWRKLKKEKHKLNVEGLGCLDLNRGLRWSPHWNVKEEESNV